MAVNAGFVAVSRFISSDFLSKKKLWRVLRISVSKRTCMRFVGLAAPELEDGKGKYKAGQLFIHKALDYRGMILMPVEVEFLERHFNQGYKNQKRQRNKRQGGTHTPDYTSLPSNTELAQQKLKKTHISKEVRDRSLSNHVQQLPKHNLKSYYLAFIDKQNFKAFHGVLPTFTYRNSSGGLYQIPGLDYVAHHEVFPYNTTEDSVFKSLEHDLKDRFLVQEQNKDSALTQFYTTEQFDIFKNHSWVQLEKVYKKIYMVPGIAITVMPFYVGPGIRQEWRNNCYRLCTRIDTNINGLDADWYLNGFRIWKHDEWGVKQKITTGEVYVGPNKCKLPLTRENSTTQFNIHVDIPKNEDCVLGGYISLIPSTAGAKQPKVFHIPEIVIPHEHQ